MVTDKKGIRVYNAKDVTAKGKTVAVAPRGPERCNYFELVLHKPPESKARPAKESCMNVPGDDASVAVKKAYKLWQHHHNTFSHMKKENMLKRWPELMPLKE